jgi:hypothetical protein
MSDELKREQARVARRVIENFVALRVPSFTEAPMRGSEERYIDRVIYEAIDAAARAAVKEIGEDTKIVDWLSKQAWTNREGYREIHHEFKGDFRAACLTAMQQQQPGGKP